MMIVIGLILLFAVVGAVDVAGDVAVVVVVVAVDPVGGGGGGCVMEKAFLRSANEPTDR